MPIKFFAGSPSSDGLPVFYPSLSAKRKREVRSLYVDKQHGLCSHCGCSLDGPPSAVVKSKAVNWSLFPGGESFLRYPVHLHHDHETGLTLGTVHAYCNAVLWQYHGQ